MESVGQYNILERLGWGALGDVYRARDTRVGRTVALMQPPPRLVADPVQRQQFTAQARNAVALNHPNIAALFDVVEQDDRCYLAYEFAAGPSLRQEMSGVPLGVRRALETAAQIADALAEGHSRGVVHGDLRPETIVITPKGSTKVLNFGMVPWTEGGAARRLAALSPDTLSPDEALVVPYLSPEQALGESIDARSDIFTLGTLLYEMLTGVNPFHAASASATLVSILRAQAPPASSSNPEVLRELDALLARTLSKDLDTRPQSAALLAGELRGVLELMDARSGERGPATLIPPDDDRASPLWWAVPLLAAGGGIVWWLLR
jgi:eukaryotic-like serine/threonine-protein kinase